MVQVLSSSLLFLVSTLALVSAQAPPPEVREAITKYVNELNSLCSNEAPVDCNCVDGTSLSPPWNVFALARCKPETCNCADGTNKPAPKADIQRPPPVFQQVLDKQATLIKTMCDGEAPLKCKCTLTAGILTNPGNASKELLGICGANMCRCADGSSRPVPTTNNNTNEFKAPANNLPSVSFGFGK